MPQFSPTNASTFYLNSAATTNATLLKNTGGNVLCGFFSNSGAAAAYVKIFNLNAAPNVGVSVPYMTILVPPTSHTELCLNQNGFYFDAGISLAITALATDADATAVAASQVKVILSYT